MSEVLDVDEVYEPSDLDVGQGAMISSGIGKGIASSYKVISPKRKVSHYISFSDTGRITFSDVVLEQVIVSTGDDDTDGEGQPAAGDYVGIGLHIEKSEVERSVDVPLKTDPTKTKKEKQTFEVTTKKSLVFEFMNQSLVDGFGDDSIKVDTSRLCGPTNGNTKHIQGKRWLQLPELKSLLTTYITQSGKRIFCRFWNKVKIFICINTCS